VEEDLQWRQRRREDRVEHASASRCSGG
jgi:hypothetical protein